MRLALLLFLFLIISFSIYAQGEFTLESFNAERLKLTKDGMYVLGGWAVGNMLISGGMLVSNQTAGSTTYFYRMNTMWNTVNIALAGSALYTIAGANPADFDLAYTLTEQNKIEKLLLVNAGLDLAYIATGLYLVERSKNRSKQSDMFKGFGQSLWLQGGFLLAFDSIMYAVLNGHGNKLIKHLPDGLTLSFNSIQYQF